MNVYVEEFVLDFQELTLIPKAVIGMACQADVSTRDTFVLKRLEQQPMQMRSPSPGLVSNRRISEYRITSLCLRSTVIRRQWLR